VFGNIYEYELLMAGAFFLFFYLFEGLLKQWSYAPDDSDYMLHLQVTFMYILFWRWG
jgi:surface polysaccharide O-acyltransferase-like enzyme